MPGSFVFILTDKSSAMKLKLVNNLTKSEYNLTNLEDKGTSRIFWNFDIVLPSGLADGEYSYVLAYDNGVVEATGLLQVGDYVPDTKPYKGDTIKESNGFITYGG